MDFFATHPSEYIRFFDILLDMFCVLNYNNQLLAINSLWEQTTGYTKKELISSSLLEIINEQDHPDTILWLDLIKKGKTIDNLESRLVRKDKTNLWHSWQGVAVPELEALYLVGRDITETKKLQEKLSETQRHYHRLFNSSPDAIILLDPENFNNIEFNDLALEMTGYGPAEFSGMNIIRYLQKYTVNRCKKEFNEEKPLAKANYETTLTKKNGQTIEVYVTVQLINLSGKNTIFCTIRNISEIKKTEKALFKSEIRFREIFDTSHEGIWILDSSFRSVLANDRMSELLGYSHKDFLKKDFFDLVHPECRGRVEEEFDNLAKEGRGNIEMRFIRQDGITLWTNISATFYEEEDELKNGMLLMVSDITRVKEAEEILSAKSELLEQFARNDSLTKLMNHKNILQALEARINEIKRYPKPLSILMIDIDHFKRINDKYGHQFGDEVLTKIAETLRNSVRNLDIVGRYGGEEFMVIMPETTAKRGLVVANRLKKVFTKLKWKDKDDVILTFSAGLREYQGESLDDFVKIADDSLYEAKEKGRDRVICK